MIACYAISLLRDDLVACRFSKNWLKLRIWQLEEFDRVLVLDSDTVVTGDISRLFRLPGEFAMALNLDKHHGCFDSLGVGQAGLILLRPCQRVLQHMLALLQSCTDLQFRTWYAEQEFLDWCVFSSWHPVQIVADGHSMKLFQVLQVFAPITASQLERREPLASAGWADVVWRDSDGGSFHPRQGLGARTKQSGRQIP